MNHVLVFYVASELWDILIQDIWLDKNCYFFGMFSQMKMKTNLYFPLLLN